MNYKFKLLYSFTIAVLICLSSAAKTKTDAEIYAEKVREIPGSYIVTLEPNSMFLSKLIKALSLFNGQVTSVLTELGIAVVKSADSDFLEKVSKLPGILSIVPDLEIQFIDPVERETIRALAVTNPPNAVNEDDKYYNLQWGLDAINAPEAWDAGYRGKGALVAVLDTGFDLEHPDIKDNIVSSLTKSFVSGEPAQWAGADVDSHGTHVAGIIAAADNGVGIIGVAPEAKLMLVKVLSDEGSGAVSDIINGIYYAVNNGADVINLSLGGSVPIFSSSVINNWNTATNYAYSKGVTVIAAAGNDGSNRDSTLSKLTYTMPAEASNVIAISATGPKGWAKAPSTTNLDAFATYSNYGTRTIDFAAPGGGISYTGTDTTTFAGVTNEVAAFDLVFSSGGYGSYFWAAGTSMAAPHATGVAALIIGKNNGNMTPNQVLQTLKASADDLGTKGQDKYYGYGRLNALKAVQVTTKFNP